MDDAGTSDDISINVDKSKKLTLSPIAEINESINNDSSSILDEVEGNNITGEISSEDDTLKSIDDILNVESDKQNVKIKRQESEQSDYKQLRYRLDVVEEQYKCLLQEHEDLREFTQLEKQVCHQECLDEANQLKSELNLVGDKVQHLIKENENLRHKLVKYETDVLETRMALQEKQKKSTYYLLEIVEKLKENIENGAEEIFEEYPSLEIVLQNKTDNEANMLPPEDMWKTLEGIKKLTEHFINNKNKLKCELNNSCLETVTLKQNNDFLVLENEQVKRCLNNAKTEIDNLEKKISFAVKEEIKLKESLKASEIELQQNYELLSDTLLNKQIIENNIKTCFDSMQENVFVVLNEIQLILDSPDCLTYQSISLALERNDKLLSHVNFVLNPQNRALLFKILLTVDDRIKKFEETNMDFEMRVIESKTKSESKKILETQHVNDHIFNGLVGLEKNLTRICDENVCLDEEDLGYLKEENKKLKSDLNLLQLELEKVSHLQKMPQNKTIKIENEIETFQTNFPNPCDFVLNGIENIIDSLDFSNGLEHVINVIDINHELFQCFNPFLNSSTNIFLSLILYKLKAKLLFYNEEINSRMKYFATQIEIREEETNTLKTQIKFLENTVNEQLTCRVLKLESYFISDKETLNYQEKGCVSGYKLNINKEGVEALYCNFDNILKEFKCIFNMFVTYQCNVSNHSTSNRLEKMLTLFLEKEHDFPFLNKLIDKEMKDSLLQYFIKLDTILYLDEKRCSSEEKNEELNVKVLEKENCNFKDIYNDVKHKPDKLKDITLKFHNDQLKVFDNDPVKQLATFKQLLITEILQLNGDDNDNDLLDCSPEEILTKLMQCIIEMEKKVQNSYELKLQEQQEYIEYIKEKNNNSEVLMNELKKENIKLGNKFAILTDDLKNAENEIYTLKSNISEKTTENINLQDKINQLYTTKNYIKNNLQQDSKCKTKEIDNLSTKVSDAVSTEKVCYICKQHIIGNELIPGCENKNNMQIEVQESLTSASVLNSPSKVAPSSEIVAGMTCLNRRLNEEKILLQDLLSSNISTDSNRIFDKLHLLKDVAHIAVNKIIQLETLQSSTQTQFQNTLDLINTDLKDFKLSLLGLYNEFVPVGRVDNHCPDAVSLKNELESIQKECLNVQNLIKTFQISINLGQSLVSGLKEQLLFIMNEALKKDQLIDELNNIITYEKEKNSKDKLNLQSITKQINLLNEVIRENTYNKSYIITSDETIGFFSNQCTLMNTYIENIEYKLQFSLKEHKNYEKEINHIQLVLASTQNENKNLLEKINYLSKTSKDIDKLKASLAEANEGFYFFSYQCNKMNLYINRVEAAINELQSQKNTANTEYNIIKDQFTNTKKHLEVANKFINELFSILPSKPKTPNMIVKLVKQIISELNTLREKERNCITEHLTMENLLISQTDEIKSLKKLNDNLKNDLAKCEDHVRNLRSEVRILRCHYQKRSEDNEKSNVTNIRKSVSADFGIQTEVLCCSELEKDLSLLKQTLNEKMNELAAQERRIQIISSPHIRRSHDLEHALLQAKQRIKELNLKVMELQNFNKELIELYRPQET